MLDVFVNISVLKLLSYQLLTIMWNKLYRNSCELRSTRKWMVSSRWFENVLIIQSCFIRGRGRLWAQKWCSLSSKSINGPRKSWKILASEPCAVPLLQLTDDQALLPLLHLPGGQALLPSSGRYSPDALVFCFSACSSDSLPSVTCSVQREYLGGGLHRVSEFKFCAGQDEKLRPGSWSQSKTSKSKQELWPALPKVIQSFNRYFLSAWKKCTGVINMNETASLRTGNT